MAVQNFDWGTSYTGDDAKTAFEQIQQMFGGGDDKKPNPRKAATIPAGMSYEAGYSVIITIGGKKYRKYTQNTFAQIGNWLNNKLGGDDDYFVEHQKYDKADDEFIHEAFDTRVGYLAGSAFFSVAGRGLGLLIGKTNALLPEALEQTIFAINEGTEGGTVLLNGSPSSAINSAMYYETAAEQGASILRSISNGHMFIDGNKRTAFEFFKYFAKQSGLRTVSDQQIKQVVNPVAVGTIKDVSTIAKMLVK